MQTEQSVGLFRGWAFKIMLLATAMICFIVAANNVYDRLQFSMNGVSASIEKARPNQQAPTNWSDYEGVSRSDFDVKLRTSDGKESTTVLYLSKETVSALLDGQAQRIVFVKDNQRKFKMDRDPLPPFGTGLWVAGFIVLGVFLFSLRLK